mgnify:CR=1 FL=1
MTESLEKLNNKVELKFEDFGKMFLNEMSKFYQTNFLYIYF